MSSRLAHSRTGLAAKAVRPGTPSLDTLFAPLRAEELIQRYWPSRPLVQHGTLERLGTLVGVDALADFRRWPFHRKLSMTATLARGGYQQLRVEPEQALLLYSAGATIGFSGAHTWHPTLRRWVQALAAELGVPSRTCHANVYLSPAGEGVPKHFDAHSVIAVQLVGEKSWQLAPNPEVVHPLENYVASEGSALGSGRHQRAVSARMPRRSRRVVMRPGSAIFLPAGFWHATRAREASLSVTFGVRVPRFFDLLRDALSARLARLAAWREPALGAWGTTEQRAAAQARLALLLAELPAVLEQLDAASILRAAREQPARRRPAREAMNPPSPRAGRAGRRARSR